AFLSVSARSEAAGLAAAAVDAEDWFMLAVTRLPFVVAAVYAGLMYLRFVQGVSLPAWIPDPDRDGFREMCLLYVAFYFAGKGVVLAHVQTSHFTRTGRRLFGAGWVRFVLGESRERYVDKGGKSEMRSEEKRRHALQENEAAQSPRSGD